MGLLGLTHRYIEADCLSLMTLSPERKELVVRAATNVCLLRMARSVHANVISAGVAREWKAFRNGEGHENFSSFTAPIGRSPTTRPTPASPYLCSMKRRSRGLQRG